MWLKSHTFCASNHVKKQVVATRNPTQAYTLQMIGDCKLTVQETRIVWLICDGLRNSAIAKAMGLAEGTVKEYLNRLFRKLGVSSRTELAVWAILNNRHKPPPAPKTVTIYPEGVATVR